MFGSGTLALGRGATSTGVGWCDAVGSDATEIKQGGSHSVFDRATSSLELQS